MDTIEAQLAAALEAASAKDTEVTEARAAVEKVASENLELAAKVTALEASVAALSSEKADLLAKVSALESSAVSATEEAAKIAASVGVAPVESNPADAPVAKTDDDIKAEFLAMPHGIERTRFYQAHRATLNPARRR
jgi:chromosome segregation ATPase